MFSIIVITILIIIELTLIKNLDIKPVLAYKKFKVFEWLVNNYSYIAIFLAAYIVSVLVNASSDMVLSNGDKRELYIVFLLLGLLTAMIKQLVDLKPVQFQLGILPPDSQEIKKHMAIDSDKRTLNHMLYFVFILSIIASTILGLG